MVKFKFGEGSAMTFAEAENCLDEISSKISQIIALSTIMINYYECPNECNVLDIASAIAAIKTVAETADYETDKLQEFMPSDNRE